MQRSTLVKFHLLLAAFLLPAVIMFPVTGGLYTWGEKGSYVSESFTLTLPEPLQPEHDVLQALVSIELANRDLPQPSGKSKIKRAGTSYVFEWTGADHDVTLEPTADPLQAKLTVKDTTWYRLFVQLHKAKGGELFKVYAAVFSVGLLVILGSGLLMALQSPKLRGQAIAAFALGLMVFLLLAYSS